MKYLVMILLIVAITCDVYHIGLSLGLGLSIKNAVLYMAAMAFSLRMVVQGGFKFTLPRLHGAFALLIGYAMVSVLLLVLVVKMPGYHALKGIIALKSNLVDHFLFFAVCYYGAQSTQEALSILKTLLVIVVISSAISVINAAGVMTIGAMEVGDNGRAEGAMGEPNQYAAFLATMVPPLAAAMAVSPKRLGRLFWAGGILLSLIALIMTVSRGGILALLVASCWALMAFRRYLPVQRLMIAGVVTVFVVLVLAAASGTYGELLQERVISQTFVNNGDASSGRSQLWQTTVNRMMESPWTLVSGFGWYAYESMGFRFLTHNSYLLLWFNLGLPGLLAFIAIFVQLYRTARKAIPVAAPEVRTRLIGMATGLIGAVVAIFFVNLFTPWPYIWALMGLNMRLAVNELAVARGRPQEESVVRKTGFSPVRVRAKAWNSPQDSPVH